MLGERFALAQFSAYTIDMRLMRVRTDFEAEARHKVEHVPVQREDITLHHFAVAFLQGLHQRMRGHVECAPTCAFVLMRRAPRGESARSPGTSRPCASNSSLGR
jgi:hypothetical protein